MNPRGREAVNDANDRSELTPILHGTLGSVAQESRVLPAPLLALRRAFTRTLHDYADGNIDRTSVSLRLAALTCVDGAEQIWTIGASTGRWYRRTAQARTWTPADPAHWVPAQEQQPESADDASQHDLSADGATVAEPATTTEQETTREYGAPETYTPSPLLPAIRSNPPALS